METQTENVQDVTQQQQPNNEEIAKLQGWRPKEEYSGDPEKWVDAETFNQRGQMMAVGMKKELDRERKERQKLEDLNRQLRKSVDFTLMETARQMQEKEADLKHQFEGYVNAGKGQEAVNVQNQISQNSMRLANVNQQLEQQKLAEMRPALEDFVQRNEWYNTNQIARAEADSYFNTLLPQIESGRLKAEEALSNIEAIVSQKHNLSKKTEETGQPLVQNGTSYLASLNYRGAPSSGGSKASYSNLDPQMQKVVDQMIQHKFSKRIDSLPPADLAKHRAMYVAQIGV